MQSIMGEKTQQWAEKSEWWKLEAAQSLSIHTHKAEGEQDVNKPSIAPPRDLFTSLRVHCLKALKPCQTAEDSAVKNVNVWRKFNFQTATNYYSLILAGLRSVLVKVSPPVIQHYGQQEFVDEGVYFVLHFYITVHYQRKSGQESRAESWSQKLKKKLWRIAATGLVLVVCSA